MVGLDLNQSKADKSPDEWLPPRPGARCQYALDWIDTKSRYQLTITGAERAALATALDTCTPSSPLRPIFQAPPPVVVVTTPTTTTTTTIAPSAEPGVVALLSCDRRAEEVIIANTGGETASLSGFSLHDEGFKHSIGLAQFGSLEPAQSLIITTGDTASSGDGRVIWKRQNVWNNDGDTAFLVAPDGTETSARC